MKSLSCLLNLAMLVLVPSEALANLQNDYQYGERSRQYSADRCNQLRRMGNYTREGGGSWNPEYYLQGETVYRAEPSNSCDYEWKQFASLDIQRNVRFSDIDKGTCTYSVLFKKKGTDLISFTKSDCFINPTDGVEKACYVPIDWQKGERKYPYCGCFDNPVPSWMTSSGYCKNASFGGFLRNLLFSK